MLFTSTTDLFTYNLTQTLRVGSLISNNFLLEILIVVLEKVTVGLGVNGGGVRSIAVRRHPRIQLLREKEKVSHFPLALRAACCVTTYNISMVSTILHKTWTITWQEPCYRRNHFPRDCDFVILKSKSRTRWGLGFRVIGWLRHLWRLPRSCGNPVGFRKGASPPFIYSVTPLRRCHHPGLGKRQLSGSEDIRRGPARPGYST